MNYKKLSYIPLLAIAVMSSCSNDNELNSTKSEYVNSVHVTVEDFLSESPTSRTTYTVDNTGFHFQWADGDALGIYPVGGDQVKFPISNGDGSASATFDGGAWKLRSNYQYAAYYPFSADNYKIDQKALPVSFTGQTQNGNGSTAHLGAYDYLACAATAPNANGGVDLTMKHLGAFLRLQLTMPKADTYSSVTLESNGAKFVTSGTFDLTSATPTITPTATSSSYTINLTNISTTSRNQMITVYAIVAPANLSSSQMTIHIRNNSGTTFTCKTQGKNFEARMAYSIDAADFAINDHEYVDLGLPSHIKWATCNVGASSPEEEGNLYAWGETSPKSEYSWSNYKWGSYYHCTKYVTKSWYGIVDNRTNLLYEDDAAYVNWGEYWSMPYNSDYRELFNSKYCSWTWTTLNDVKGYKIVSKTNGNSIFLPYSGGYWTKELGYNYDSDEDNDRYSRDADAFYLYFNSSVIRLPDDDPSDNICRYTDRYRGLTIRPVFRY